jgi:flagellin
MSLGNSVDALEAIGILDDALAELASIRANIGAYTNRLDSALSNQENALVNIVSAESLIRDTDFATEMTNFTRLGLLQQASTSMLAQANSLPNSIMNLLNF